MGIIQIPVSKIGAVVGPGGKVIKAIQEKTGVDLSIDDDGNVQITGRDASAIEAAKTWVEGLVAEVEIGKIYTGKVTGVKPFGCFVELIPGKEGMCHVSEFSNDFVKDMEEIVQEGDEVTVKVLAVDPSGRVKLSRKATLETVETGDASE
jgi:polyribonucleotide nucleotidyltransferase